MDLTLLVALVSALSQPLPAAPSRACVCPRAQAQASRPAALAPVAADARTAVPTAAPVSSPRATAEAGPRIAINTATSDELQALPGVGPRKADRIVEARAARPFRRPSDLRRIPGFGPKTILRLAPLVTFGEGG